jgi:hypothetical protein
MTADARALIAEPDPFEDARMEELSAIPIANMPNEELGVLESECLSIGGERGGRLRAALSELRRYRADVVALRASLAEQALVIEQQDREVERMRTALTEARLIIENQNQVITRLQRKPSPVVDVDVDDGPIL